MLPGTLSSLDPSLTGLKPPKVPKGSLYPPGLLRISFNMYSLCQTLLLLSACASQFVDARAVGHQAQAQAQARACTASGSFRVNQIPVRRVNGTNALMAYAKVLRKYAHHADSTDDIMTKAGVLAEASSVVATPFGSDTEYVSPVTIGDQTFQTVIDTGSSDLSVKGDHDERGLR